MAAPTGYAGITLEGQTFPQISVDAPTVRRRELKSILDGGPGGRREHLAWRPAGYPVRTHKVDFSLAWKHVRDYRHAIEEILAGPGPFRFCFWKYVHLRYVGDGVRTEFFLPHELGVATDSLTPPQGDLASYLPEVKIGLDGTPLTYVVNDQEDYESGEPEPGEVWFLELGNRFKLAEAPALNAAVCARYVPLLSVLEGDTQEKRYTDPIREPRSLELSEV